MFDFLEREKLFWMQHSTKEFPSTGNVPRCPHCHRLLHHSTYNRTEEILYCTGFARSEYHKEQHTGRIIPNGTLWET